MAVGIAHGLDNGRAAQVVDSEEIVWRRCGFDAVDGDLDVAVGAVLESDRHRQPGCQLAVHLRLGGASTDRAPGDRVGDVLRAGGFQELTPNRKTKVDDAQQQPTGSAYPTFHVEAT